MFKRLVVLALVIGLGFTGLVAGTELADAKAGGGGAWNVTDSHSNTDCADNEFGGTTCWTNEWSMREMGTPSGIGHFWFTDDNHGIATDKKGGTVWEFVRSFEQKAKAVQGKSQPHVYSEIETVFDMDSTWTYTMERTYRESNGKVVKDTFVENTVLTKK